MAKKMNKDTGAIEESTEAEPTAPVFNPADDFENSSIGEVFGGSYTPFPLEADNVSPLMEYVKDTKIPLQKDDGEEGETELRSVPVAKVVGDEANTLYTLPLSAVFSKHWKEAEVQTGDHFAFKRYADAKKKRGKGAGNTIRVYAVKVYQRATPAKAE